MLEIHAQMQNLWPHHVSVSSLENTTRCSSLPISIWISIGGASGRVGHNFMLFGDCWSSGVGEIEGEAECKER